MGGLLERFLRFDQEAFAGMGEADRTLGLAGEQLGAEQRFQGADLMTERGRGDVETRRRARKMQFFGDGDEVTEVAKFHRKIMR